MNIIRKIGKFILCVILPVIWLLIVHISTGFSNHWIDYSINLIAEFTMKGILIWYISGLMLKMKNKKTLFVSLSISVCLSLTFAIPYFDKIIWCLKEVNLPVHSQIDIANYIFYENTISGWNIIHSFFWFVYYVVLYLLRCKSEERKIV